jgi:PAS domain S-box-containing protein
MGSPRAGERLDLRQDLGGGAVALVCGGAVAALPLIVLRALGIAGALEPDAYLPLHAVGSVALAAAGFAAALVQWAAAGARGVRCEARGRLLGAALLATALLETAQLLAFPGMPGGLGAGGPQRAAWYWCAARAALVGGLAAAAVVRRDAEHLLLQRRVLYLGALGLAVAAVGAELAWPAAIAAVAHPARGAGPAGGGAALALAALAAAAATLHAWRWRSSGDPLLVRNAAGAALLALGAFAVATEPSTYDVYDVLGIGYATAGALLVFQALFAAALLDPYAQLDATTHELASSNARLDALRAHVEGELHDTIRRLGDATEREALARSELEAAFAAVPEGIVAYDASGGVERMNAAAERMLGYGAAHAGESLHARWAGLAPRTADGKPLLLDENPIVRALRGESVPAVPVSVDRGGGHRLWLSVSAAPMRGDDGRIRGAIACLADVGAMHEVQAQREDLLRAVSHDLRNPLQIVLLQAERLQRLLAGAAHAKERHAAERIAQASRQMGVMIRDLVEAARMESGRLVLQRQPVELRPLVERLLAQSAGALDVARVRVDVPSDLPPADADPARLERVLVNLVGNALKYSPEGGEVRVGAEVRDGAVVVSVADRGLGIAPEDLPRVFERFFRGQRTQKADGLGLGLYIVQLLVEAHGGKAWAESTVGEGSTFRFTLPMAG